MPSYYGTKYRMSDVDPAIAKIGTERTGVELAPGGRLTGNWHVYFKGHYIGAYSNKTNAELALKNYTKQSG